MLFNSYEFIFIFLPISFFIYFVLNKKRLLTASKLWLIVSSLFFYSWWNIIYLPLILLSIIVNYIIAIKMTKYNTSLKFTISKKTLLLIGLSFNLGLLGYFKYMDFFITNINFALDINTPLLHLALPLAISFFTLQQVAFLIDSYEGLVKERNFLNYMSFVTFFPQLIAGPIVHHDQMMPQFSKIKNKIIQYENISKGLFIFSIGLFKKVIIADSLAIWVSDGFDKSISLSFIEGWITSLAYTFQIYFDFSGYMDMAIGIALLFNIKLPKNFNSPYQATGIIDYWQRWHITLTNFITTYVYTPILRSFSKITFTKSMIATFIAMFISGLWHGAGWTYIIWGSLHGIALIINHYWKKTKFKMNTILAWFITFNFVNITGIFFRANDLEDAWKVLEAMFGFNGIMLPTMLTSTFQFFVPYGIKFGPYMSNFSEGKLIIGWLLVCFIMIFMKNSTSRIENFKLSYTTAIFSGGLFVISALSLHQVSEFLYFNF